MAREAVFYRTYGSRWRPEGTIHLNVSRRPRTDPRLACRPLATALPYGHVVTLPEVRNVLDGVVPPRLCGACPGIRRAVYDV